jgi:hypothetical protein
MLYTFARPRKYIFSPPITMQTLKIMTSISKDYWQHELPPPLSPSEIDVNIYKSNLCEGDTLLLGCTHKLIPLSIVQMDIDPWYEAPTVINLNWRHNKLFYTNIIGDGVLNFSEDLANAVILMSASHSKCFVTRSFKFKLPEMKIAAYFPTIEQLPIKPTKIVECQTHSFFVWQFR